MKYVIIILASTGAFSTGFLPLGDLNFWFTSQGQILEFCNSGRDNNCFFESLQHAGIDINRASAIQRVLATLSNSATHRQILAHDLVEALTVGEFRIPIERTEDAQTANPDLFALRNRFFAYQGVANEQNRLALLDEASNLSVLQHYLLNHVGARNDVFGFTPVAFNSERPGLVDIIADLFGFRLRIVQIHETGEIRTVLRERLLTHGPLIILRHQSEGVGHFTYLSETGSTASEIPRVNWAQTGGDQNAEGNELFKKTTPRIVAKLMETMQQQQEFSNILRQLGRERSEIAGKGNNSAKEDFGVLRSTADASYQLITSLKRYPLMEHRVAELLRSTSSGDCWYEKGNVRYRFRLFKLEDWGIWSSKYTEEKQVNVDDCLSIVSNLFGSYLRNSLCVNFANTAEGELQVSNPGLLEGLVKAATELHRREKSKLAFIKLGVSGTPYTTPYRLAYFETEIHLNGRWNPYRCFFTVLDGEQRYEDSPMLLIHPPSRNQSVLEGFLTGLWESALSGHQLESIGRFIYYYFITMPYLRGSAAIGEWMLEALLSHARLLQPRLTDFAQVDQLAQSSLTEEEFLKEFYRLW